MKIKAVVLDMDGLMVDSEPFWRQAELEVFPQYGVPLTMEQCIETTGIRIDEIAHLWFRRFPWEGATPDEVAQQIIQRVEGLVKEKAQPLSGVNELISQVKARKLPLALASSSPLSLIYAVLDKFGIRSEFDLIKSAEFEKYGKPHPGVYTATVEELGLPSENCLTFEDSLAGIIAAKAAGMKAVAVPQEEFKNEKRFILADIRLERLDDFDFSLLD
jgi:mannitol-1-/sugar-/sorbitol-6-/2-deoxyglucose-6-phosphatase